MARFLAAYQWRSRALKIGFYPYIYQYILQMSSEIYFDWYASGICLLRTSCYEGRWSCEIYIGQDWQQIALCILMKYLYKCPICHFCWIDWKPGKEHFFTLPHDMLESMKQAVTFGAVCSFKLPFVCDEHWSYSLTKLCKSSVGGYMLVGNRRLKVKSRQWLFWHK